MEQAGIEQRETMARSGLRPCAGAPGHLLVWDRFVRVFHWSLAAATATAAVTGFLLDASWIRLHIAAGSLAAALLATRIVWGFTGPGPARFSSFVTGPRGLLRHLDELRRGRARRHLGHNPLGGAMILALGGTVMLLALSGVSALGGALAAGPLAAWLTHDVGAVSSGVHELLAIGLLLLVAGHLAGVFFESRRQGESLVRAMMSGCRQARPGDAIPPAREARVVPAVLLSALLIGSCAWAVIGLPGPRPERLPVAAAAFDPLVAEECSACHMLYNPALLPAADWKALMAGLEEHFGEDASLDESDTARIRGWLVVHAAETVDLRPARLFRISEGERLLSITETAAWKELHESIAPAVFERNPPGSASNCRACHRDAEDGLFSPFRISVPKETTIP